MGQLAVKALLGFVPVLCFLAALVWLDSYKLLRVRTILWTILLGGIAAVLCYIANVRLIDALAVDIRSYSRYVAPIVEELAKAIILVYFIRSNRVGFLVDASILGFGVGTGFAVVENAYYMQALPEAHLIVWLVRGLGTALMHGGTATIFAVVAWSLAERKSARHWSIFWPGLLTAMVVHSLFNHLFFNPVLSTLAILLGFPPLLFAVFQRSEAALRDWLDVGFDSDTELLQLIHSGQFSESRVGRYLQSLKERFRGEIVADLLCYLTLHVELSLRAKGILMMRESGFKVTVDEETLAKFEELKYLEGSMGKTGKLAMQPFLHVSGKELWQLYMLGK